MKKLLCKPVGHYGIWEAYLDNENEPKKIILECTYCGRKFEFKLSDEEIDLESLMLVGSD